MSGNPTPDDLYDVAMEIRDAARMEGHDRKAAMTLALVFAYKAGQQAATSAVRTAQAAAVRGAGEGMADALRRSGRSLNADEVARLTREIAATIELDAGTVTP